MAAKLGAIFFSMLLVNNYVLVKFLGICPFLGVSRNIKSATGMSVAVTIVMCIATAVTWPLEQILEKYDLVFLQTIAFIMVIAVLVQLLELVIRKFSPSLYSSLGVFLPLITTNCAVLGVALLNVQNDYDILTGTIHGFATAIGFWLAIVILAFIREKMVYNDVPKPFKGFPIVMITSALMSIAFFGFAALK